MKRTDREIVRGSNHLPWVFRGVSMFSSNSGQWLRASYVGQTEPGGWQTDKEDTGCDLMALMSSNDLIAVSVWIFLNYRYSFGESKMWKSIRKTPPPFLPLRGNLSASLFREGFLMGWLWKWLSRIEVETSGIIVSTQLVLCNPPQPPPASELWNSSTQKWVENCLIVSFEERLICIHFCFAKLFWERSFNWQHPHNRPNF